MTRLARTLVVTLVAVLAIWSIVQSASTTTMSLEMAAMTAANTDAMYMADCAGCDSSERGDEAALLCHLVCVAPILADLRASEALAPVLVVALPISRPVRRLASQVYPPDPYPPRSVLLV